MVPYVLVKKSAVFQKNCQQMENGDKMKLSNFKSHIVILSLIAYR